MAPKVKAAPNYKVRMDPTNRTLDSMIQISHPSQIGDIIEAAPQSQSQYQHQTQGDGEGRPSKRRGVTDDPINIDIEDDEGDGEIVEGYGYGETQGGSGSNGMWTKKTTEVPESECDFTSILELRDQVRKRGNSGTSHLPTPISHLPTPIFHLANRLHDF